MRTTITTYTICDINGDNQDHIGLKIIITVVGGQTTTIGFKGNEGPKFIDEESQRVEEHDNGDITAYYAKQKWTIKEVSGSEVSDKCKETYEDFIKYEVTSRNDINPTGNGPGDGSGTAGSGN